MKHPIQKRNQEKGNHALPRTNQAAMTPTSLS